MSEPTAVKKPHARCGEAICQCSRPLREAVVMRQVGEVEPVAGSETPGRERKGGS